ARVAGLDLSDPPRIAEPLSAMRPAIKGRERRCGPPGSILHRPCACAPLAIRRRRIEHDQRELAPVSAGACMHAPLARRFGVLLSRRTLRAASVRAPLRTAASEPPVFTVFRPARVRVDF